MKQNTIEVAKRIRKIRTDLGYSMAQFGELISDSPKTTVNNWERGINLPKEDKLKKIALLGKTTVEELLYGSPEDFVAAVLQENFDLPVRQIELERIINLLKSRRINPYDEMKVVELIQTLLDNSTIKPDQHLNYMPIPGSPNMYLAVPKSQSSNTEEPPAYYAYVSQESNMLHLLPYTFVPNGEERYFNPPNLENKEEYSYVTDQFPVIGLKLEGSKIVFYGRDREDEEKKLSCFIYDEEKKKFFIYKRKEPFNLVSYFFKEINA